VAAQRLCTGGGARVGGGGHGWRDESAGVGDPTYGVAEPSACGSRRGRSGDPGGGATRPLRRGKGKKLTSGPQVSERRGRGSPRLDWAGATAGPGGGEGVKKRGLGELGRAWREGWAAATHGREERRVGLCGKRPAQRERKGASRAGLAVIWFCSPILPFLFFSNPF
jgi:hypothetical protein